MQGDLINIVFTIGTMVKPSIPKRLPHFRGTRCDFICCCRTLDKLLNCSGSTFSRVITLEQRSRLFIAPRLRGLIYKPSPTQAFCLSFSTMLNSASRKHLPSEEVFVSHCLVSVGFLWGHGRVVLGLDNGGGYVTLEVTSLYDLSGLMVDFTQ